MVQLPDNEQQDKLKRPVIDIIGDCWNLDMDPYAVFDADGTIWNNDISESLLAKLELDGSLTETMLSDFLKPIPFYKDESLYSYYLRLCCIDAKIGYLWIAMVFSGFSLGALKEQVDELMGLDGSIPIHLQTANGTKESRIHAPKVFSAQKELINTLTANGIQVYIVTAALEVLSRMIASNPKYGVNIPPENVIGVNLILKDSSSNIAGIAGRNAVDDWSVENEIAQNEL